MNNETPHFQTKGLRDGLLVTFSEAPWNELVVALENQIKKQLSFFRGARLALDVGDHALKVSDLSPVRDMLSEFGIFLWAVLSTSSVTTTTAQNLGLATRINKPQPPAAHQTIEDIPAEAAKWIKGPLRSGTKVTHEGCIVIIGDVNPGAEIVASGSILVWGRLRGTVHAGAGGDEQVFVCALELTPTQLRIADRIAVSPKKNRRYQPEIARISGGDIIAEPWHDDRKET